MTLRLLDASAIAIVDDDEAVRTSGRSFLRSLGFEVFGFASGEEFLAAEASAGIGCVLLDLRMKGRMNGLSVLRTLRRRGSPVSVVILSGRVEPREASAATRLGAIEVLEKPCGPYKLLDSIGRAFSQWRSADYTLIEVRLNGDDRGRAARNATPAQAANAN
jgi:FixJ family two-component response regulator